MINLSFNFIVCLVLMSFSLALVLNLLGFLPFLFLLIFLASVAGFGFLVCPKYLEEKNIVFRLALYIVVGLQLLALAFLFVRLIFPQAEKVVFFTLLFFGLSYFIFQFVRGQAPHKFVRGLTPVLFLTFLILGLLLISNLMVVDKEALYFQDNHHPIYELSIARSVELSLPPQDLSFAGKPLKFHFLSAILTSLFYKHLGFDPLVVVYRVFPLLAVSLFLPLSLHLARIFGLKKQLALLFPFLFLFFYPFVLPLPSRFSLWPETQRALIASPSYTMGFLGFLALLILILEAIKQKKNFSWPVCILGAALFMTKASFFIPLGLAVGLFFLQKAIIEKKPKSLIFPLSMAVFTAPFYYFLSGAHSHNLWILAPDALIFKRLPDFLHLSNSWLSWPLMFLASPFIFYGFFSLVYFFGFFRFWKNKKIASLENFLVILMVVSCSFPFFLSEATEGNVRQFILPGTIGLCLLPLFWFKTHRLKKTWLLALSLILVFGLASGQIVNKTYRLLQKPQKPSYSLSLARALAFLNKNSAPSALILFGKHYESPNWQERQFIGQWDYQSFFRTALSGRNTLVEDFKYRGIGLEKDYNVRGLENFGFFFSVVLRDKESAKGWLVEPGYQVPVDHKEKQANLWFLKPLWLTKGPNWFTIRQSFPQFLENNWSFVFQVDEQWLLGFLDFYNINYILFERGERPHSDLVSFLNFKLVFEQNDVALYQREF